MEDFNMLVEIASVTVGIGTDGHIVIKAKAKKHTELLGLSADFDRAAAAFCREFAGSDALLAAQRSKGSTEVSPELEKLFGEAPVRVVGEEASDGR